MSEIPRILAIEPNSERASALVHLVHDYVEANVVVSASAEVALAVMARQMPELILLSPFTPPSDEQSLIDVSEAERARIGAGARHVFKP